ncbi:MAG: hemolysin family protein [Treponema sp.]|nr:hemolysin family protein [Treponema sp.]
MDNHTFTLIVSLVILLCFSAFFSASEMAFSSLNRIRLKNLAARNNKRARLALKLLESYDKLLSSVLIGNNIVNIASSALATVLFVEAFGSKGVSIATLVMTVLVLVFGEISPKTLAKESPEFTALGFAPLMRFFMFFFTPLSFLAACWKKLIVRIFPVRGNRSVTEDELLTFVEEVRQEGGINKQEEEMIRQVIEFDDLTAAEIFTPRIDIAAVSETDSAESIDLKFAQTGFSRLPVYRDNIDNITGVILLKDFHHEVINRGKPPASVLKPVVFVTRTIKISKLLRMLQRKRAHMAVLVDEFGGTLGIVTIEDIVEELVGEIWDEHDEVVEPVRKTEDGAFIVLGSANLRDMFDAIKPALPAAASGPESGFPRGAIPNITAGSWALEKLGGLPRPGDVFESYGLTVRVSKVLRHRIMELTVTN